jgi:hypothetical protein
VAKKSFHLHSTCVCVLFKLKSRNIAVGQEGNEKNERGRGKEIGGALGERA